VFALDHVFDGTKQGSVEFVYAPEIEGQDLDPLIVHDFLCGRCVEHVAAFISAFERIP
jgi:hypothetical protein